MMSVAAFLELFPLLIDHPPHCQCAKDQYYSRRAYDHIAGRALVYQAQRGRNALDFPYRSGEPCEHQAAEQAANMSPVVDARLQTDDQVDDGNKAVSYTHLTL